MKKTVVFIFLLLAASAALKAEVLSVDPAATPKPIKIFVEGVEDATPTSLTTQKEVFFKNELFQSNTRNSIAQIKKIADKNPKNQMESEVIDAIIVKLADMEDELKKQQLINTGLQAGIAVLAVMFVVVIINNNRKKKK